MTYTIAGINFAHFHMGDNLSKVHEPPDAEIVAIGMFGSVFQVDRTASCGRSCNDFRASLYL